MSPPTDASAAPTGVIHDIGYRRYEGRRLGRGYAARSLYVYGTRTSFGIGRGAKAKIFPWIVIGIVLLVAVVAIAVRSISGQVFLSYTGFVEGVTFPVLMFLAVVAPELVSRDLRDGVLPLYFSRPLRRVDYALTKLGALVTAVFLLLGGPLLLIYIGGVFTRTDGWKGTLHETNDLWPGLLSALIQAIVLASLSLLIASATGRRAFAAAFIVAVFLVTAPIVGVLYAIGGRDSTLSYLAQLVNPMTMLVGATRWLFPWTMGTELYGRYGWVYGLTALLLAVACVAGLLARYRKVAR